MLSKQAGSGLSAVRTNMIWDVHVKMASAGRTYDYRNR